MPTGSNDQFNTVTGYGLDVLGTITGRDKHSSLRYHTQTGSGPHTSLIE